MKFKRFRDRRVDEKTREKHRETHLHNADFILPLFILDGENREEEIGSMPTIFRRSLDRTISHLKPLMELGLESVLVFGVPDSKGLEQSYKSDGLVQRSISKIKSEFPTLEVIADVCICSYSEDGHCHIGDNDETCELLAKIGLSYARAGADAVAPSDMMDGRVSVIKRELDLNSLPTQIISYSAKFASSFYGPFRDAADCAPQTGDRKEYQMDSANGAEALLEIEADIEEGTGAFIIKPALSYLDIIAKARSRWAEREIIAYSVSGEFSMIYRSVEENLLAESVIEESLISIKRAGANRIITYWSEWFLTGRPSIRKESK
jgi:porphobilinogen synthase